MIYLIKKDFIMVKDAMGYKIELNSYYAYSDRKNGIVNVTIGKA